MLVTHGEQELVKQEVKGVGEAGGAGLGEQKKSRSWCRR